MHVYCSIILMLVMLGCQGQTTQTRGGELISGKRKIGKTVEVLDDSLWYVFQDTKNHLWFGSDGEGVFNYDGIQITQFTKQDGLCSNRIRQILEDESGNIYFSTLEGINKYDGNTISKLMPVESNEWKLQKGDLWFYMIGKSDEYGPYRYDGKTLHHLRLPKHKTHDDLYPEGIHSFFSPYEVYCIYKDRSGAMWFGTSVFGACRYDGHSLQWIYEKDLSIAPNGGTFGIRSIFEDREGLFWICNTQQRFQFEKSPGKQNGLLQYTKLQGIGNANDFGGEDLVFYSYILEDNDGNIWLTTWEQGVFKFDGTKITRYLVQNGSKTVNLVSMHKDHQGVLWLGTIDHGAFKWDGKEFKRFNP